MVGPTKVQPRRFSSLDSAIDSGEVEAARSVARSSLLGRDFVSGSYFQKNAASEPCS